MDVEVQTYCNGHTCTGCATLQLRQLCAALEMCMNTQCFGTVVNHGDLLCDAGMLVEALYSQSIALYVAAWNVLVNVVVSSVEGSVYEDDTLHMEWASDAFYSVACEAKDVLAAATAFLATLMYTGGDVGDAVGLTPAPTDVVYGLEGFSQLSGEAGNQIAVTTAAVHQLLYQGALAPLYAGFAFYRFVVCEVTDIISMVCARMYANVGARASV